MKITLTEKQAINILNILIIVEDNLSSIEKDVRLFEDENHNELYLAEVKGCVSILKTKLYNDIKADLNKSEFNELKQLVGERLLWFKQESSLIELKNIIKNSMGK